MKVSGNKADLIGCMLTLWKRKGTGTDSDALVRARDAGSGTATDSSTVELPILAKIQKWKKDISSLKDFTFMQLYHYLVNSRDKTIDKGAMKAFKSLKAYKYFSDHLVLNVWASSEEGEDIVVIRGYYHSSLKSKTTYTAYVVPRTSGDVLAAQCKCVAGKG